MMKIKDWYEDCISNNYSFMAHALYYLLREGIVSPDDPPEILDSTALDLPAVKQLMGQNYLGLNVMKPYSLKVAPDEFVFVFAKDKDQAVSFLQRECRLEPLHCHEYHLDFSLMRGNTFITFREMKKEFTAFPAVIGVFSKRGS